MSLKESAEIDVGYPGYGIKFVDNKTFLVAGGGGEGNNGIPNKITAIKCSFKIKDKNRKLQRFREITLPANEDSPTCIEINQIGDVLSEKSSYSVFVGCNQSTQLIKSMNINNNLRKYIYTSDEHLKFIDAAQLDPEVSTDSIGEYPKAINLSKDNSLGVFLTSRDPSTLFVFDPETLECTNRMAPNIEIRDFHLSPFGTDKKLTYITASAINVVSISANEVKILSSSDKNEATKKTLSKYILTKVRYISEDEVLITANIRKGGAAVLRYNVSSNTITKINEFSKKIKGLVALDCSTDQDLIAVAANDFSLTLIRLSDLKVLKTFKKLHTFAITGVSFSPNGSKLATVSASNSVRVFKIPKNFSRGTSLFGTLVNYIFYTLLIGILAIIIQSSMENGSLDQYLEKTKVYGIKFFEIASDISIQTYEIVKDKIKNEKLEVDEETQKFFTIDDWDDSTDLVSPSVAAEEVSSTPFTEPVKDQDMIVETSVSQDFTSSPLNEEPVDTASTETTIETTASTLETADPVHEPPQQKYVDNTTSISNELEFTDQADDLDEGYQADTEEPVQDQSEPETSAEVGTETAAEVVDSSSTDVAETAAEDTANEVSTEIVESSDESTPEETEFTIEVELANEEPVIEESTEGTESSEEVEEIVEEIVEEVTEEEPTEEEEIVEEVTEEEVTEDSLTDEEAINEEVPEQAKQSEIEEESAEKPVSTDDAFESADTAEPEEVDAEADTAEDPEVKEAVEESEPMIEKVEEESAREIDDASESNTDLETAEESEYETATDAESASESEIEIVDVSEEFESEASSETDLEVEIKSEDVEIDSDASTDATYETESDASVDSATDSETEIVVVVESETDTDEALETEESETEGIYSSADEEYVTEAEVESETDVDSTTDLEVFSESETESASESEPEVVVSETEASGEESNTDYEASEDTNEESTVDETNTDTSDYDTSSDEDTTTAVSTITSIVATDSASAEEESVQPKKIKKTKKLKTKTRTKTKKVKTKTKSHTVKTEPAHDEL